jgi:hypothetical protein
MTNFELLDREKWLTREINKRLKELRAVQVELLTNRLNEEREKQDEPVPCGRVG